MNLLFTSGGRRVELLRAFRRAYEDLGLEGNIVTIDIDPLAPALSQVDRYYMVPRIGDPGYIPAVVDVCERERINFLIPLVDRDIPVLVRHRDAIEAGSTRALIPTDEGAAIVSDKWLTYDFFCRLGIPTAASWTPDDVPVEELEYPVFIKPRFGSAGEGTFVVRNRRELEFFVDYVDRPIIQEFLPGPEITSDVLCDLEGNVSAVVSRRRIEVRTGEVAKGVTVFDSEIAEGCVTVAKGLESVGPITVQCIMKDDRPYFTEVNHRLGGGIPLAIAAGAPFPLWLLADASGRAVEVPPIGTYETGVYLTRYDESMFISEEARDAIKSHRL